MKRREFIGLVGGTAAWPFAAAGQKPDKVFRIGNLSSAGGKAAEEVIRCFRKGLEQLGWVERRNISIEYRYAEGRLERFPALAAELVNLKLDLIASSGTQSAQALKNATRDIPIVFMGVSDPVASGIVASLAYPGANITGVSNFLPATTGKLLELLKSLAPKASSVIVIRDPANAGKALEFRELQAIGPALGMKIEGAEMRNREDIEHLFANMAEARPDAIVTLADGVTFANRERIVELTAKASLPAIYQTRGFVDAGGLMSYGLNFCQHYTRAAAYVDRILKGAKPADMPVELPTTFELIINMKIAKELALEVPPLVLAQASEVIE